MASPPIQSEAVGGLQITEFAYNPPGLDEEREWVEVANLGAEPVLLAGYGLADEEEQGGGEGMLRFPDGSVIAPGQAIVVAQTAVGFRALFGVAPDFEVRSTDLTVPDMVTDASWATGQFFLANDGDEIVLLDEGNGILDALNYGDRLTYFTPAIPAIVVGQSLERVPATCDTDSAADWRPQTVATPGEVITEGACAQPAVTERAAGDFYLTIGEIQGPGDVSPYLNQLVSFRGVVTGTLEDRNTQGITFYTLFVQDPPGAEDGELATSDGIAVFLGRDRPAFAPGDQVAVTGLVTEYFGLTEIDDSGLVISLEAPAQALPAAAPLNFSPDALQTIGYLEAHEGMLVRAGGSLPVVGPTHAGCGFAVGAGNETERPIQHSGEESPAPVILVLNRSDIDCSDLPALKSGDRVSGISGPLTYHFEQYKIVQQENGALQVEPAPWPEPPVPPDPPQGGAFSVVTLNLSDFLEPAEDATGTNERPTVAELATKQRKLAQTLGQTLACPTLVGVQEVESRELLQELATDLTAICGFTYQVSHAESADARGIDVALLSDPRRATVTALTLHQTCALLATGVVDSTVTCLDGQEPLFSRPPLEINLTLDGEPLAVIVNHFKSKRGGAEATAPRRLEQAAYVQNLVRRRLEAQPQAALVVLGDFNDFDRSDVWRTLLAEGLLSDSVQSLPEETRYSYIFDGAAQLVDGILVSPALVPRLAGAVIPHVNADFPETMAGDLSAAGLPFRSSDHDPLLVWLLPEVDASPTATPSVTPTAVEVTATITDEPQATQTAVTPATTRANTPTPTVFTDEQPEKRPSTVNSASLLAGLVGALAGSAGYLLLRQRRR